HGPRITAANDAGLEAGADGYLTHPVEPLVLIATIKAFLRTRQMEAALSRSEAKFRAIFDQALMGICLISDDMIYLDANPAFCQILGRAREELVGKHCSAFARAGHESKIVEISELLQLETAWCGSLPLVHRGGHIVELEWSISIHSAPNVLLAIISDVTEKRRIESEREHLLESERSARTASERANRLKDEFLATLSHELRTPLNAIVGWSQLLQMQPPTAKDLAQGLEAIARNAKLQSELINDLLDVSRIISGKLRLDMQRIDPVAIVHDALISVTPAAQAKGVHLLHNLSEQFAPIHADPSRLQQVVWNIINNAVKFTPPGGSVRTQIAQTTEHLVIRVSDTGQGIKPEFLPHLFERFRQEDATTTRSHGGLGLGLAIVKHILELHGGAVEAHSAGEGLGSEFVVRLSLMGSPSRDSSPNGDGQSFLQKSQLTDYPSLSLRKVRVVIVDDDHDARTLVGRVLREFDAEVAEAENVAQALLTIESFKPQVLVSDIGMPNQDGYDLIREVRKAGHTAQKLPAIAVTAFVRSDDRRRILDGGYQMHLGKPITPTELVSAIATLVAESQRA
ncbi:MAG: ATP-binding protein, partial [Planctomycetota bacterium]